MICGCEVPRGRQGRVMNLAIAYTGGLAKQRGKVNQARSRFTSRNNFQS